MNLTHLTEVLRRDAWIAGSIAVGSFVFSIAATIVVVVRIPEDYFVAEHRPMPFAGHSPVVRWAGRIGLNVVGLFLIALGVVMSIPGVPGQGLLTILFGIMLIDVPGKRSLEGKLIRRPALLRSVNRLRARYKKPPILTEPRVAASSPEAESTKSG